MKLFFKKSRFPATSPPPCLLANPVHYYSIQPHPHSQNLNFFHHQETIQQCLHLLNNYITNPSQIRLIHAKTIISGTSNDPSIISKLLQASDLNHALLIFNQMTNPVAFHWNSMIQAYSKSESPELAIFFYIRMLGQGDKPNEFTLPSLIGTCGYLSAVSEGTQMHCHVFKMGFGFDQFLQSSLIHMYSSFGDMLCAQKVFDEIPQKNVVVWTALVNGYSKFGDLEIARQVFDEIPEKDVVAWSAMISGYVQKGKFKEGLSLFNEMQIQGVKANESVLVSVLSACAQLGALDMGRWVHFYVKRRFTVELRVNLGTALVDMYAKCGVLSSSLMIFQEIPNKNVFSWNVMMGGFAMYGDGRGALGLFSKMLRVGMWPDEVTFLGLLGSFSHGGMVDEGTLYFETMPKYFAIHPTVEHYACVVDLLARAGFLERAKEMVLGMPIEPDACVWGALLGGCRVHGDIALGAWVGERLIEFEPDRAGRYVLLSNLYAAAGRWNDARHIRALMKERGVEMRPGFSSIEVEGLVHEFVVGDRRHPKTREIHDKLEEMAKILSMVGYSVDTKNVLYDMDEEDKELQLSYHSEKLAIAFGLISMEFGTPIRIVKNLRVCSDCHNATKILSKVYEREIIVRDSKRFHHFKDGFCSCSDYW